MIVSSGADPTDANLNRGGNCDGDALDCEKLPPRDMQHAGHRQHRGSCAGDEAREDQHDCAALFHRVLRFEQAPRMHESLEALAVDDACAEVPTHPDPDCVADDESAVGSEKSLAPLHLSVIDRDARGDQEEIFRNM